MTIQTRSSFYYIDEISIFNRILNFKEDGNPDELTAEIAIGSYSMNDLAQAVQLALNDAGSQEYTVTLDRTTRFYTISAATNFELLVDTGSAAGASAYSLLGFTGSDLSGTNTYTSDSAAGTVFNPQYLFQNYIQFDDWQEATHAKVNESGSGIIETVSFGQRKFSQFDLMFITDIPQNDSKSPIENNPTGVADARAFFVFATKKGDFEFMPDRDNPAFFCTVLLESLPRHKDGTGFTMQEMYSRNLAGYYTVRDVKLRLVSAD